MPAIMTCAQAEGERIVLAANGRGGLATVALRPSNVYGEHDPLFFPKLIAKAGEGKMKYRIGNGMMTPTYAGNAAHAHVQVNGTCAACYQTWQ